MTKQLQYLLWFAITLVCIIVISCSDEFLTTNLNDENITFTNTLGKVEDVEVVYGYRDSMIYLAVGMFLDASINRSTETGLNNTMKRVKQFNIKWKKLSGATDYDIRVYKESINEKNWKYAQRLEVDSLYEKDGFLFATVSLNTLPNVKTGKCVGCGICVDKCPVNSLKFKNGKVAINRNSCVECGECARACIYDAISGTFAGSKYYISVRGINVKDEYSVDIGTSSNSFMLRYSTLSSIPTTLKKKLFESFYKEGEYIPFIEYGGCTGNCSISGCYIVGNCYGNAKFNDSTVCPVNAIYEIDSLDIDTNITKSGAIYIDKEKCIYCGNCVYECFREGPWGAVTSEVVEVL